MHREQPPRSAENQHGAPAVLQLLAPAAFGGLERVVTQLAVGLTERGHRVAVGLLVEVGQPDPGFVGELTAAGVDLFRLVSPPRGYRRERRLVRELLAQWRPAVVHTHGYRPDVLLRDVIHQAGCGAVSTVHGFTGGGWKNWVYERLDRRALRRFDAVVAVSVPAGELLAASGVAHDRIAVIPNAWSPVPGRLSRAAARERLGLPAEPAVIGWVGRLSAEKGPDLALGALAALPPPRPLLAMIGGGPEEERLKRLAERLAIASDIRWCGAQPDAGRLFGAFDLFLLSSRTEGTPMVLFEAVDAGVPIVASAVGGVPGVVTPAEAELVASEPAALAQGIARLLADPDRRAAHAAAARTRIARHFAPEAWLGRYAELYRRVISQRHVSPLPSV